MNLTLTRPLVFVDLEATGPNPEVDHIVQIACIKYLPPTGAPDDNGDRIEKETLVRPPVAIPAEATEIHGITDDMVKTAPTFRALAKSLAGFFEGADVAGYNVKRFDWPMLLAEFARAGVAVEKRRRFVDAQAIFFAKHPRTLSAAAKLYCGEEHADAHSALADIRMTEKVLWAQLGVHDDLPRTVDALDAALFPVDPDAVDPDGKLSSALATDAGKDFVPRERLNEVARNAAHATRAACADAVPDPDVDQWSNVILDAEERVRALDVEAIATEAAGAPSVLADILRERSATHEAVLAHVHQQHAEEVKALTKERDALLAAYPEYADPAAKQQVASLRAELAVARQEIDRLTALKVEHDVEVRS